MTASLASADPTPTPHDLRGIAVEAGCDPRTVLRRLAFTVSTTAGLQGGSTLTRQTQQQVMVPAARRSKGSWWASPSSTERPALRLAARTGDGDGRRLPTSPSDIGVDQQEAAECAAGFSGRGLQSWAPVAGCLAQVAPPRTHVPPADWHELPAADDELHAIAIVVSKSHIESQRI